VKRTLVFQQFYDCFSEKGRECLTNEMRSFGAPEKHEIKLRQEKPVSLKLCACNKPFMTNAPDAYAVLTDGRAAAK